MGMVLVLLLSMGFWLPGHCAGIRNGTFEGGLRPWEGCHGNRGAYSLAEEGHSGRKSLRLDAGEAQEVRVFDRGNYVPDAMGRRWILSLWAKGGGSLAAGFHEHGSPTDRLGLIHLGYFWTEPAALAGDWREYRFEYVGRPGGLTSFLPMLRLRGGQALVDDVRLEPAPDPGWRLTVSPRNAVAFPGGRVDLTLRVVRDRKPVPGERLRLAGGALLPDGERTLETDARGTARLVLPVAADARIAVERIGVALVGRGLGECVHVDVVPEAMFRRLDAASARMRNPGEVLVLGDSLSDFLRGYNYVDTLEFFLDRRHPGKSVWHNYGIRGDKVPRTLKRFQGGREWSWERYQGIWDLHPDTVVIFLGHNDSLLLDHRLGPRSPTQVPPEQFTRDMLELIREVRARYGKPRIVLFTPVLQDYRKSIANSRKLGLKSASGEPAIAARFRDLVIDAARQANCQVVDMHAPTAACPHRDRIFNLDGVHLNALGNKILAETFMAEFQ